MKKACIFLLVLVFALSLVSVASAQEEQKTSTSLLKLENFSQKGSIRARWYNVNNAYDYSDDTNDNDNWFDQRLRLQGKYEPVKGYSLNYRVDIGEGTWGTDYAGGISNRPSEDVEFQFDQLYMRLDPGPVTINIGQHMCIWGNMWVFEPRATGATMRVKVLSPFIVDLHWGKRSEGGSNYDRDGNEDEDLYGAQLSYMTKELKLNAYYGALNDKAGAGNTDDETLRQGFGFAGKGGVGPFQFNGELTFFSGENKTTDVDYVGTQLVAEAIYNMKSAKIGARFYYAQASDDDEAQITCIQLADPNDSFLHGIGGDMERDLPEFTGVGHMSASSPASFFLSIFDPTSQGAGVVGGTLYADYQVTEKLLLTAGITYLTPQDGDKTDLSGEEVYLDSLTIYNLGVKYDFLKELYMAAGMTYWTPAFDDDADLDEDAMFGFSAQVYLLF